MKRRQRLVVCVVEQTERTAVVECVVVAEDRQRDPSLETGALLVELARSECCG